MFLFLVSFLFVILHLTEMKMFVDTLVLTGGGEADAHHRAATLQIYKI